MADIQWTEADIAQNREINKQKHLLEALTAHAIQVGHVTPGGVLEILVKDLQKLFEG